MLLDEERDVFGRIAAGIEETFHIVQQVAVHGQQMVHPRKGVELQVEIPVLVEEKVGITGIG